MLTILALLASFVTAPIGAEEVAGHVYLPAYFDFSVTVQTGEVATVTLYDEGGSYLDDMEFYGPGTYTGQFDVGDFLGTEDVTWRATCVWDDGSLPYPVIVHWFNFQDDFQRGYKWWYHGFHF